MYVVYVYAYIGSMGKSLSFTHYDAYVHMHVDDLFVDTLVYVQSWVRYFKKYLTN